MSTFEQRRRGGIDLSGLNAAIEKATEDVEFSVAELQRTISIMLLEGAVKRTPVDTGRAKGNWQLSIGTPETGEVSTKLSARATSNPKEAAKLNGLAPYSVVWLSNNVTYIEVLEFGGFVPKNPTEPSDPRPKRAGQVWVKDGYSVQAPGGMLRLAIADVKQELG
tara:strand:+ start:3428 stop:3922 length:495 start_codon:yes stop_codon:yes gene_type:complete